MTLQATAYAKVNLCLHVTGRRPDGYHLLDSLVTFADYGDELTAVPAETLSLTIGGRFGAGLDDGETNLVVRAARLAGVAAHTIRLEKRLPVAAGIGGGSADAAACLRMFEAEGVDALSLGADVPVCLRSTTVRMSGIGERLTPVPPLPPVWVVLANCGQPVATGAVFAALANRDNPPMTGLPKAWDNAADLFSYLRRQRNDLEGPAVRVCPDIGAVLAAIAATADCGLARMSGSGGTCFGLYATEKAAEQARADLTVAHPDWWVVASALR